MRLTRSNSELNAEQWLAFQYVAGELSDDETEAFELRMLEDVRRCDAVAEASRLTCAISTSVYRPAADAVSSVRLSVSPNRGVPAVERRNTGRPVAVVAAVCCCLALALLTSKYSGVGENRIVVSAAVSETSEAELLLDAWTVGIDEAVVSDAESSEVYSQELDVPEWLFTAVAMASVDSEHMESQDNPPRDSSDWF